MNTHIVICIPCLLNGGTELQTLCLAKVLRDSKKSVTVVCLFKYSEIMVNAFAKNAVEVVLLRLERESTFIQIIVNLKAIFKSIQPHIVHVQYMSPGALPIIAARLSGIKKIFATVHQPWTRSHGRVSKLILRTASILTTKFIAVSLNAERSWFGNATLFDEYRPLSLQPHHFTIHNAVDTDKIKEITAKVNPVELKSRLSILGDAMVVGTVSRLRHEKGIDVLIEAFSLLSGDYPDVHLLIVGSGPDEERLKLQANDSGIARKVTFYGAAEWEPAIELMSIMDIVVVPSRFEGFGLTAAEAMASGKPVVASDTSGLQEVVLNEATGLLFPVDNAETLKISLERLLRDPGLRESMGNAGRARAIEKFNPGLYVRKITALYSRNVES